MSIVNRGLGIRDDANQAYSSLSGMEAKRNATNNQIRDAERQQTIGNVASGAMIGTQIMPGWGTAIGAGVGLLVSLF